MVRSATLLLLAVCAAAPASGQTAGLEVDALPYITGGHFAAAWAGHDRIRVRALSARVFMPDVLVPDDLDRHRISATALLIDVFRETVARGWWVGGGLVRWDGALTERATGVREAYEVTLVNGSLGYARPLGNRFYVSPWAGLSIRVAGDDRVSVGGTSFTPRRLNPELSVKAGWKMF